MFTLTSKFARTGVIALGTITCLGWPAMTAPLGRVKITAARVTSNLPVELASDRTLWRVPGGRAMRSGGGNWNRNWSGNRDWKGRHWKNGHRRYYDYDDDNSGIVLGLGLGGIGLAMPLFGGGYYGGGYYPRSYYRAGNGHEQWCYARYRSYRAWDNTFQPYNGPRRQCNSPYG
jgi:hypothetical protein